MTFSVVFAYVADVTTEEERSSAYGLVSSKNFLLLFQGIIKKLLSRNDCNPASIFQSPCLHQYLLFSPISSEMYWFFKDHHVLSSHMFAIYQVIHLLSYLGIISVGGKVQSRL